MFWDCRIDLETEVSEYPARCARNSIAVRYNLTFAAVNNIVFQSNQIYPYLSFSDVQEQILQQLDEEILG